MAQNSYGWSTPNPSNYGAVAPRQQGNYNAYGRSLHTQDLSNAAMQRLGNGPTLNPPPWQGNNQMGNVGTSMGGGGSMQTMGGGANNAPGSYYPNTTSSQGQVGSGPNVPTSNGQNWNDFLMPPSQYQDNPGAAIPQMPSINYGYQNNPGADAYGANSQFGRFSDPNFYRIEDNSRQADRYYNNYLNPMLQYGLQYNDQQFNQTLAQQNFNAQMGMNQFNMGLQRQAALRENAAFNAGLYQDNRNFGENARQFDASLGAQREYQTGQLGNERFGLENQNTFNMGQLRNQQAANANERFGLENQNVFNQGQLGLGQGRLSLDTRQLSLDDQYRYRALAQEDELARQQMANQLTQSRYQAFGRNQAPNFRASNAWG